MCIYRYVQKLTQPPEDNELQTSFENPQKVYKGQSDWLGQYMYWIYAPSCRDYDISHREFL